MPLAEVFRLTPEEFALWRAYDEYVQPIGDQRLARQAALQAALYANAHRGEDAKPFDLDDFDLYPVYPKPPVPQDDYAAAKAVMGVVVVEGG